MNYDGILFMLIVGTWAVILLSVIWLGKIIDKVKRRVDFYSEQINELKRDKEKREFINKIKRG